MCGRFTLGATPRDVVDRFNVVQTLYDLTPRYNIAPTQPVGAVIEEDGRTLQGCQWGLVPFWADDPSIGNRLINARADTLRKKPAFRSSFKRRRCLIPADGFYEWQRRPRGKVPVCIRRADGGLLAFAGLWDEWQSPDGSPLRSCAIVTTDPNDLMAKIHNRMPAILAPDDEAAWLDPANQDTTALAEMLRPFPSDAMTCYPVSRRVNNPAHDDPDLLKPAEVEGGLFS